MIKVLDEVLQANKKHISNFDKGDLPMSPARQFSILTCMDVRLGPAKYAGLSEGDAHVISNAGDNGTTDGKFIKRLTISDQAKSVLSDVERIRNNSMVPSDISIYDYIYYVKTGKFIEVPAVTQTRKAS